MIINNNNKICIIINMNITIEKIFICSFKLFYMYFMVIELNNYDLTTTNNTGQYAEEFLQNIPENPYF